MKHCWDEVIAEAEALADAIETILRRGNVDLTREELTPLVLAAYAKEEGRVSLLAFVDDE